MNVPRTILLVTLCLDSRMMGAPPPQTRATPDSRFREWHVTPDGVPAAQGTSAQPLDLASALDGRRVAPGDTIWLHEGQYIGKFRSNLTGTEEAPITVRQWPGERATLAENKARGEGAVLNVFGEWTIYRDFEVTNLNRDRSYSTGFRPMGLEIQAPHIKVINLVVHDTGIALGVWDTAPDAELYGNIIYNSGSENNLLDKRHGHAIYSYNKTGMKQIRENVMFNQFGWGMHIYSNVGSINGFLMEGNVAFNSGIQNGPGVRYNNLLVMGHGRPYSAEHVVVQDNFTYHSFDQNPGTAFRDANVSLGCDDSGANRDLVVRNNYFAGGSPAGLFCNWEGLTVMGNTFVGPYGLAGLLAKPAAVTSYQWDRNHYYGANADNGRPQFGFNGSTFQSWDDWKKATRIDANSTYSAGRPESTQVFVRPNAYDSGRANIIVYNWEKNDFITADLRSVFSAGTRYEIRDVQDYYGEPVLSGTADGRPLRIPMRATPIRAAEGVSRSLQPTSPEFGVFVAQTISAGSTAAGRRNTKSRTPSPTAQAPAALDRYAGEFESARDRAAARVTVRGQRLALTILTEPGKPVFELEPITAERFRILGTPAGFFVCFNFNGGPATGIQVIRGVQSTVTLRRK